MNEYLPIDGKPLICGGRKDATPGEVDGEANLDCYRFNPSGNSWDKVGSLPSEVASTRGNDYHPSWGLVISGKPQSGSSRQPVVSTRDGINFREYAPMPEIKKGQCTVIIDSDRIFTAGNLHYDNAYMYSKRTGLVRLSH